MSGHAILQIVKGIQKVPGDTLSAEQGLDSIDLLDTQGFSTDFYEMKIPALKSSAVYADSPLTDGRTLISGALGNVTETIRVTLTSGTMVQLAAMLSKLLRFKQDCNDFWDTFGQIEPVYIKHQIVGEPGPRYALLFDIDIAIGSPTNPNDTTRDVTIVIEREYGWRGLAPGSNPKEWTLKSLNQQLTSANCSLMSSSGNLITDTLENATEWTSTTVQVNKNYIDIPAALIPGDLPALVCIATAIGTATGEANLLVARSTKPTSLINRSGLTEYQYNNLLAASLSAGGLGTDTTLALDTGGGLFGVNRSRAQISFATVATDTPRLTWRNNVNSPLVGINSFRGRFAVFARARQVGGAAGDIRMSLEYGIHTVVATPLPRTTEVFPTIQAGVGNTTDWPVTYMGVITLPNNDKAVVNADGLGLYSAKVTDDDFRIALFARRTAGAGVLYVCDLMLVPIDESCFMITAPSNTANTLFYDTTGYFRRGQLENTAFETFLFSGDVQNNGLVELKGDNLFLQPNTNNRIYIFAYSATFTSKIVGASYTVFVNIVPRWSGIRDK